MLTVDFAPLFPPALLGALAGIALLLVLFGAWKRARGLAWRSAAMAAILAGLFNPVIVEEEREIRPDVLTVVIDESTSQEIGERNARTAEALSRIEETVAGMRDLELRTVRAGGVQEQATGPVDGTQLFRALGRAVADVPRSRMAGTIVITDGQVHDVPAPGGTLPFAGPLHVMLTGERDEIDRRLVIVQAPKFGIVGKEVELKVRVEDTAGPGANVPLTLVQDGGAARRITVPAGRDHTIRMKLDHAGDNILQMEAASTPGELTEVNNRAVIAINGVRERLRVLLVSGEPHPGERVWRNLLKADPSVDLVHFTILRPPEKQDMTPVRELSLIAFPIRELFEVKLNEFDLIIFDRYRRRGVLPSIYYDNIARYVEAGGAVLEAAGPEFASPDSLYQTPLGRVLPGEPTGKVFSHAVRPRLTETGQRHTVTADLPGAGIGEELPRWGKWFRHISVSNRGGLSLMSGQENQPMLLVSRVKEGRVAQLLSDHIWLWARGYNGGGPHSELLRRVAHWLMKEPELEENALRAEREGANLAITRRSVEPDDSPVTVTTPSGRRVSVTLKPGIGGRSKATIPATETGIFRVEDGKHTALAAVGNLNPLEFADMRTTETRFARLVETTGGGFAWLTDGAPELRRVRAGRLTAGRNWMGLVENRNYSVKSVREAPLLPALALLLLGLGTLVLAWRAEGR
ncbi:MAG: hypothetical protein GEU92_14680 [Alphaproteobacteria bacterium]|nr:hypothetical protein [Alphaproteobacteria bacterium]